MKRVKKKESSRLRDLWKDPSFRKLTYLFITFKISILVIMLLAYNIFPIWEEGRTQNYVYPEGAEPEWWSAFQTWDSHHYIFLSEQWYAPKQMSNMFYPLYPLTIMIASSLFGGNHLLAGMFLSHIFAFIALAFLYLFARDMFNRKTAMISCMLFLAFPTSFFTGMAYTEGLFFMLTVMFMFFLYRERFWPALVCSFFIPLTRPTGFLLIAPLFFFLLYRHYKEKKFRFMPEHLHFLGFTAGLGTYLAIMKVYTGSWFTGFTSQVYSIADNSIINFFFLPQWFMRNFWNLDWTIHTFVWSAIDRIFFGLFLIVLYLIYREMDTTMFMYAVAVGLVPAFAGNFLAYTRYLLVVFPIYLVLAKKLKGNYIYIFIPMIILQTLFMVMHSLNYWVA